MTSQVEEAVVYTHLFYVKVALLDLCDPFLGRRSRVHETGLAAEPNEIYVGEPWPAEFTRICFWERLDAHDFARNHELW